MKLSELLGLNTDQTQMNQPIIFTGEPVKTNVVNRNGQAYWIWELKTPMNVICSTNRQLYKNITHLMITEDIICSDLWEKKEEGFTIPGYIADYSLNRQFAVYGSTTIYEWAKAQRSVFRENQQNRAKEDYEKLMASLRAK